MTSSSALFFNVDNTLGALLIGGLLAATLWGVTNVQVYIYYQRYTDDPTRLKLFVALLWLLDTLELCLSSHMLYHYLVTNYFNPLAMMEPVWSLFIHFSVTTVTDVIIRSIFTWRIWRLSGNVFLTLIAAAMNLCDLIIGLTITTEAFILETYAKFEKLETLFYVSFGIEMCGDIFVAVILCLYLFKSRTGFQRTNTLLNVLITYTVTTGLFTSVDATIAAICYLTMPKTYIFIGFYFCLGKLYVNSYLALLNARNHIRAKSDGPISFSLSRLPDQTCTNDLCPESSLSSQTDKGLNNRDIEVRIDTIVERGASGVFEHC